MLHHVPGRCSDRTIPDVSWAPAYVKFRRLDFHLSWLATGHGLPLYAPTAEGRSMLPCISDCAGECSLQRQRAALGAQARHLWTASCSVAASAQPFAMRTADLMHFNPPQPPHLAPLVQSMTLRSDPRRLAGPPAQCIHQYPKRRQSITEEKKLKSKLDKI